MPTRLYLSKGQLGTKPPDGKAGSIVVFFYVFFSPPLCTIFAPTGVIVERQQKHAKVKNNPIRHSLGFFGILKWQSLEKNRASQKPQITTTCPLFVKICCRCTDSAGPLIKHGQSMALLYLDVNCFRFTGAPHGILPNTSLDLGSGQVRECKAHNVQPTVHSAHTLHIGYATTIHNLLCNVWPETVVVQGFRWRSSFWFFMLSCQSWSKRKKTMNKINLWFFFPSTGTTALTELITENETFRYDSASFGVNIPKL